ncbi:UbiA family prenyltransferase [Mesorhizobium sp. MSK_1335]|uniref:UbiA family prenyltransferase n=1 Tax=Mesorhizobium montanum TaxID=3072323 RepID=A0ABU4ZTG2_9HYPH|nr:UbiA family prenyltransferase [Mesorhizobium sp. MSK_1335]MDX8527727.1 UbiA family prenyltransferase [Mesorhizobium sp. MSK_1335]
MTPLEPAVAIRSRSIRSWPRLLSSIRFDEVCALQGTPLIGATLSLGALTMNNMLETAVVVAGNLCLVAHVFVFNDWSGIDGDLNDPKRAARTFAAKGLSRSEVGYLALSLLGLSLLLFAMVGATPFFIGLSIAGLSALYSAPGLHLKGTPLFSSALHLSGGALHFLLGYAAFSAIDARGLLVSCFFALVFTAGHFTHEARDHEGDTFNDIRTNAVAFGKRQSFVAGLVLFTAAYVLLVGLAIFGVVPRVLMLAAVLYPLHLAASVRALRAGLTFESLVSLQRRYRALYAIIGIVTVVATLTSLSAS